MILWLSWMQIASEFRQVCSRDRTYLWLIISLIAMTVRNDYLGITGYVRALGLKSENYNCFLDFFHSNSIDLDALVRLWVRVVIKFFPDNLRINGLLVLVGDGLKIAKAGKKMPGVKTLHQESENNNKSEYIMGHSCQSIGLLSRALSSVFAVPLVSRIHEGFEFNKTDNLTLLDKMILLLDSLDIQESYYFVADAYYASGCIINGLLSKGNHLITRVKPNAVAFKRSTAPRCKSGVGRRKLYGAKLHLIRLFDFPDKFITTGSPVYGEKNVKIKYVATKMLWRPAGREVVFVAVIHPSRGKILLLCTDVTLDPIEIIRAYGWRFKIELSFKVSIHNLGAYSYRFWMKHMQPTKRGDLDVKLHEKEEKYQRAIKRKLNAYHCHIQIGLIAQGLLQYLSCMHPEIIWNSFGSWLRTIRSNIPPSEMVVSMALRNMLPRFLLGNSDYPILKKFLMEKIDIERSEGMRLVA